MTQSEPDTLEERVGRCANALELVSEGSNAVADAIRRLGTAKASTDMGALELLAKEVRDGSMRIEAGLMAIAESRQRETGR